MKLPSGSQWDQHQSAFLRKAELCRSVAVAGEAGSGKSTAVLHLLQQYVRRSPAFEGRGDDVVFLVKQKALSQELAAVSRVRVETFHSFFNLGPQELTLYALTVALKNPAVVKKMLKCRLLVIDEVFTIELYLFGALHTVFSMVPLSGSSTCAPFGGRRILGWSLLATCPHTHVVRLHFGLVSNLGSNVLLFPP